MATDIDTQEPISASTSSVSPASIELGSQLLHMLQQAAQAARLESQVAQLSAALREARRGSPERLQIWLERYQAGELDVAFEAQLHSRVTELIDVQNISRDRSRTNLNSHAESQAEQCSAAQPLSHDAMVSGWERYLECARRRLAIRQQSMEQHQSDEVHDDLRARQHSALDMRSRQVDESLLTNEQLDDSLPEDFSSEGAAESKLAKHVPAEVLLTSAATNEDAAVDEGFHNADEAWGSRSAALLDDCELQPNEIQLSDVQLAELELCTTAERPGITAEPTVTRRRLGSMGFSLIGHTILLLALGMMTYRATDDAAALGSQVMSVEANSEHVEVGQEFELPEPVAMDLPEPSTSPNAEKVPTDLSQLDQQLTAPPDAASLATKSPLSSAASTLSAAVSAAAGTSGGSSSGSAVARGGGGPPTAGGKFFGVASGGNYFCYVVDSSGSMRGGAWESAKVELLRSLSSLKSTQRFYIIFFARDTQAIPEPGSREPAPYGLTATPENIDHARRWIDTVRLDRGGPPNDALELAIDREPDAIYLLTDGVTSVDVCGFLREKNRVNDIIDGAHVRVPIHSIAYFSLDGQQLLRQIAQENDGQFHYVPKR